MGDIRYDLLYDIFEMFLRRHSCYDSFVQQNRFSSLYVYVSRNKNNPYSLIQHGFKWVDSVEGFNYWNDLDSRWQRLVSELISA